MKKTNLLRLVTVLLIGAMLTLALSTITLAATDNGFNDLSATLNNTNTNSTNTNTNSTNTNTNTNNTNSALTTNRNATNNSSVYNNTSLPSTGIEDSVPVALLIVVFGISAVYAYRKIKEYKNI